MNTAKLNNLVKLARIFEMKLAARVTRAAQEVKCDYCGRGTVTSFKDKSGKTTCENCMAQAELR